MGSVRFWRNKVQMVRRGALQKFRLIKDISDHVLRNSQTLKKEVAEIMGGKILELESERLLKAGRQEEKKEAIIRMIKKHYSKEQILDLGYTESEYQRAEEELLTSV